MIGTLASLVAHQGGWDELVFVLVPIALFAGLLAIANRRATDAQAEHDADPDDDGVTILTRVLAPEERQLARQPRDDLVAEVAEGADRFTARGGPFSSVRADPAPSGPDGELTSRRSATSWRPMVWSWLLGHPYRMALARRPRQGHALVVAARGARRPREHGPRDDLLPRARLRVHRHPAHPDDHLRGRRVRRQQDGAERSAVARAHRRAGRPGRHDPRRPARAPARAVIACAVTGCVVAALSGLAPTSSRSAWRRRSCGAAPPPAACWSASWRPRRCRRGRARSPCRCSPPPGRSVPASASWRSRSPTSGDRRWRLVMGAALLLLPVVRLAARHLPESRRYDAAHAEVGMAGPRLALLAARRLRAPARAVHRAGLAAAQRVPARRGGLLGLQITLFSILTNTPAGSAW